MLDNAIVQKQVHKSNNKVEDEILKFIMLVSTSLCQQCKKYLIKKRDGRLKTYGLLETKSIRNQLLFEYSQENTQKNLMNLERSSCSVNRANY